MLSLARSSFSAVRPIGLPSSESTEISSLLLHSNELRNASHNVLAAMHCKQGRVDTTECLP